MKACHCVQVQPAGTHPCHPTSMAFLFAATPVRLQTPIRKTCGCLNGELPPVDKRVPNTTDAGKWLTYSSLMADTIAQKGLRRRGLTPALAIKGDSGSRDEVFNNGIFKSMSLPLHITSFDLGNARVTDGHHHRYFHRAIIFLDFFRPVICA